MTTKDIAKLYLERLDRNELLLQAAERAVLRGQLRPEAVTDLHELYKDKCLVTDNEVTLNGASLDDAVAELVRKRPLWQPPKDDPRINARKELEGEALAGSVSAHGRLWKRFEAEYGKTLGDQKYQDWCRENSAKPGSKATPPAAKGDDKPADTQNPFTRLRDIKTGIADPVAAAEVADIIKTQGIAVASKLAKEAGTTLSGIPLARRFG
jgi:hypothetical protein